MAQGAGGEARVGTHEVQQRGCRLEKPAAPLPHALVLSPGGPRTCGHVHVGRAAQVAVGGIHLQQAPPMRQHAVGAALRHSQARVLHSTPAGHGGQAAQWAAAQKAVHSTLHQRRCATLSHVMRAGVTACPSALRAETSSARPPQAQGDAMLVPFMSWRLF